MRALTVFLAMTMLGSMTVDALTFRCECPRGCPLKDLVFRSLAPIPRGTKCNRGITTIKKVVDGAPIGLGSPVKTHYVCTHRAIMKPKSSMTTPEGSITMINGRVVNWIQVTPRLDCNGFMMSQR